MKVLKLSAEGRYEAQDGSVPLAPTPSVGSLYSREGLIRYIMCCCQDRSKRGGLRDKPSR
jgi:protein farnesyltransferase subunit beta